MVQVLDLVAEGFSFLTSAIRSSTLPAGGTSFNVIATLLGGSLALTSHGTKSALRAAANLSPEPFSNWILSFVEDAIAWTGAILAIVAPILLLILIGIFLLIFAWFAPKIFRAMRRMWRATRSLFAGEGFREVAQKAG